jgi:hypothetical protein
MNRIKGLPHFKTLATKPMIQPLSQMLVSRLIYQARGFKQGLPYDHFMLKIDSGSMVRQYSVERGFLSSSLQVAELSVLSSSNHSLQNKGKLCHKTAAITFLILF